MNDASEHVVFRPVGDIGLMVEFGDRIDDAIHERVVNLDNALDLEAIDGVTEIVPSYASVFIGYDPLQTTYSELKNTLTSKLTSKLTSVVVAQTDKQNWTIPICYDGRFAPDLDELANNLNLTKEQIIELHLSGTYKVYMYGFAPGYAYLGGVPKELKAPRKPNPVMHVPAASVMVAGPQCLVTTVQMPSGWWVIGRASDTPLQAQNSRPFLFNVGDSISFERVSEHDLQTHMIKAGDK